MKLIGTSRAPAPIGPYSQAVQVGTFVFLSGQIPIDPKTGNVELFDGDAAQQTALVLENISAVLGAAALSLQHVVKATIFLTDLKQFSKVNEIYAKYFGNHKPARSTVEVSALPKGAAVEIEVMATTCLN